MYLATFNAMPRNTQCIHTVLLCGGSTSAGIQETRSPTGAKTRQRQAPRRNRRQTNEHTSRTSLLCKDSQCETISQRESCGANSFTETTQSAVQDKEFVLTSRNKYADRQYNVHGKNEDVLPDAEEAAGPDDSTTVFRGEHTPFPYWIPYWKLVSRGYLYCTNVLCWAGLGRLGLGLSTGTGQYGQSIASNTTS